MQHAADDPQSVQSDFAKMGAFEAEPYKRTRKTPNEQRQKYHNSGSFLSTPVGPNPQCFEYNLHSTVKNTKPDCTSSTCIGSHFSSSMGTIGPDFYDLNVDPWKATLANLGSRLGSLVDLKLDP